MSDQANFWNSGSPAAPNGGNTPGATAFAGPELAPEEKATRLAELKSRFENCQSCRLATTRTYFVFGEGNPAAEVMFIGEGPGRQEDLSGRPFVGRAGQLLTRIIEKGMGVPRDRVYIANIVKCRPTVDLKFERDRAPDADEVQACHPILLQQIEIVRPKVIVTLGGPSTKFILNTTTGITRLRGSWGQFRGIPVMPTYHPSYVLRNGGDRSPLRRDVWEDIKQVLGKLGWPVPVKG
jgi:DNA polymerase